VCRSFIILTLPFFQQKKASTPAYDLTKSELNLQRYFIYKTIKKDGQTPMKGKCRKYGQGYSRIGGSISNILSRLEDCDNAAYVIYK
jgi:hypothetical protein